MPYKSIQDLPKSIQNSLPKHGQEIFLAAFNNAYETYKDPKQRKGHDTRETTANKVAWAAVKMKYEKKGEKWVPK